MSEDVRADRYHVALFEGTNYATWKYSVLVLLEESQLDDCILHEVGELPTLATKTEDSATAAAEKQKKRKRRKKCKRLLIERIHESQLENVQEKRSPKEVWTTLRNVFERKSVASRMHLKRQILSMRFDGGRLTDHFLRFDKLVRGFRDLGLKPGGPISLYEDNQSTIRIAEDARDHGRLKHIDTKFYFLQDLINEGVLEIKFVRSSAQQADIMTKGLPVTSFRELSMKIGFGRCRG